MPYGVRASVRLSDAISESETMLDLKAIFGEDSPTPAAEVPTVEPSAGPVPIDVDGYLAEHGQYPPGGIGGPGYLAQWLAEQAAEGFARWARLPGGWERWDVAVADWDSLPEPGAVRPGYFGDPRPRRAAA